MGGAHALKPRLTTRRPKQQGETLWGLAMLLQQSQEVCHNLEMQLGADSQSQGTTQHT